MRNRTIRRTAWLLTACALLAPLPARAQPVGQYGPSVGDSPNYAPPYVQFPIPLGSTRPEDGGLYIDGGFDLYRQTNPIGNQLIAVRGFKIVDASIPGISPGEFIGSHQPALDTNQVSGPNSYQPGFHVDIGYRFYDGSAIEGRWLYLFNKTDSASAGPVPNTFDTGFFLENSFLFAPNTNVPFEFGGQRHVDSPTGNDLAAFGIFNGASQMQIQFLQRFQQYDLTYRFPVSETECYRFSGLMGARFMWIWERFQWRTIDIPIDPANGISFTPTPVDIAIYDNIISNRMYGPTIGCSQEWYLGHGFACTLDTQAALFMDIVKERISYTLGLKYAGPELKRNRTDYKFVPEANCELGLTWYPIEAVQCHIGYDFIGLVNTIGSRYPIAFDMSALDPGYQSTFRFLDGFQASIMFAF
jgi:hypothetical protein